MPSTFCPRHQEEKRPVGGRGGVHLGSLGWTDLPHQLPRAQIDRIRLPFPGGEVHAALVENGNRVDGTVAAIPLVGRESPPSLTVGLVQAVDAAVTRPEVNELVIDRATGFDPPLRLVSPDLFASLLVQAVEGLVLATEEHVTPGGDCGAHIQNTVSQYNLPPLARKLTFAANREGVAERFADESVRRMAESDLALICHIDEQFQRLEPQQAQVEVGRLQVGQFERQQLLVPLAIVAVWLSARRYAFAFSGVSSVATWTGTCVRPSVLAAFHRVWPTTITPCWSTTTGWRNPNSLRLAATASPAWSFSRGLRS